MMGLINSSELVRPAPVVGHHRWGSLECGVRTPLGGPRQLGRTGGKRQPRVDHGNLYLRRKRGPLRSTCVNFNSARNRH